MIGLFWSLLEEDSPLLLEEPELSLHAEIIRRLPRSHISTCGAGGSVKFLSAPQLGSSLTEGYWGEEVIMLERGQQGTEARLASGDSEVRDLLEGGLSIADAALPRTGPPGLGQLGPFEGCRRFQ